MKLYADQEDRLAKAMAMGGEEAANDALRAMIAEAEGILNALRERIAEVQAEIYETRAINDGLRATLAKELATGFNLLWQQAVEETSP